MSNTEINPTKHKQFKDLTNKRFGSLIAICIIGKDKSNSYVWECKCDCGNTCEALGSLLRQGRTTCCGCKITRKTKRKLTLVVMPTDKAIKGEAPPYPPELIRSILLRRGQLRNYYQKKLSKITIEELLLAPDGANDW